tara:strand:- start:165 stop:605 length:441 start_codon:yes stop_codon:yes gene_type:complete
MTIKQALKYKNKLVSKMNIEFNKAHQYNSVEEGGQRPYSASEALSKYFELSNELVELKTKLHKANAEVYDKIFLLSELKSRISKLQILDCSEGKVSDRFSRIHGDAPVIKTVQITILERDVLIQEIESKIEEVQEELDLHNATTEI